MRTTQKHDLVTPYIGMKVTRDNNMLMASPTSSHVMFKYLWSFSLGVADLICTSHITCRQDIIDLNIYIYIYIYLTDGTE